MKDEQLDVLFDGPYREFGKALKRIGTGNGDFMRWVLRFSQLDLNLLSDGDLLNLQYEIQTICDVGLFISSKSVPHPLTVLPKEDIIDIHSNTVKTITSILKGDPIEFSFKNIQIILSPQEDKNKAWGLRSHIDNRSGQFFYIVCTLLQTYAHLIRKCPGCGSLVLASRIDQEFCSNSCQAKMYMRDKRQKAKGGSSHGKTKLKG